MRPEPCQVGPVGHSGTQYLLDPLLCLREGEVNEAFAFRQIPAVHDAEQDSGDLNATCDRDHLGIDGEGDVGDQFLSKGSRSIANAKSTRYPAEQLPDRLMNLRFGLEDQAG